VRIDQVFQAQADIQPALDGVVAVLLDVLADVRRVVGHLVHHFAIGLAEPQVVLEKIAMPVDVRDHQFLIDERVRFLQIGIAGVVIDDHLIDSAQPIMVPLAEPLVLRAKSPVRIPLRESAIGGDLVHLLVIAHLKDDREEIQTIRARPLADLLLGREQLIGEGGKGVGCHFISESVNSEVCDRSLGL
jgi:hypothetical protein